MAYIDKTYTNSYKEYKEFKEWMANQKVVFHDKYTVYLNLYVYDWEEKDFDKNELPIINTPTWLDIYLIQKCPCKFIQERLLDVYGDENYYNFLKIDLKNPIKEGYEKNRKIVIKQTGKFPLYNKGYKGTYWFVQCNNKNWNCNSHTNVWAERISFYPTNTNTMSVKTIKSLVRQLRKQYLPKGLTFTMQGALVGEDYLITIK